MFYMGVHAQNVVFGQENASAYASVYVKLN